MKGSSSAYVAPTRSARRGGDERISGLRLNRDDTAKPKHRRVLIADDDDDTREMYAWCLRAAGWLVAEAANGHDAFKIAAALRPDIIVMDLRMPVLSGLDAIGRLKADERTRDIPIVICTGLDGATLESHAHHAMCDGLVTKPCPPDSMVALLDALTASRDAESPDGS